MPTCPVRYSRNAFGFSSVQDCPTINDGEAEQPMNGAKTASFLKNISIDLKEVPGIESSENNGRTREHNSQIYCEHLPFKLKKPRAKPKDSSPSILDKMCAVDDRERLQAQYQSYHAMFKCPEPVKLPEAPLESSLKLSRAPWLPRPPLRNPRLPQVVLQDSISCRRVQQTPERVWTNHLQPLSDPAILSYSPSLANPHLHSYQSSAPPHRARYQYFRPAYTQQPTYQHMLPSSLVYNSPRTTRF